MWKSGVENVSNFFEGPQVRELRTWLPPLINSVLGIDSGTLTRRLALGPG